MEVLGKRGEELVHVGPSMVEQGQVCVFQEGTEMALGEGQQGPEHFCNESKGETEMRKGSEHIYKKDTLQLISLDTTCNFA